VKRVFIEVKNNNQNPYEVDIHQGTTPAQIRDFLNLDEDYDLYRKSDQTTYFSELDDLFPLVTHEEHLIAQTIFEAEEAFMKHIAFGE
jgi:hypothetical protein